MITSVLALVLVVSAADPCTGAMDRTAGCSAPDELAAGVKADEKREPTPGFGDVIAAEDLPPKIGLGALALGIGGTALMASTFAVTPPNETEDERALRAALRIGGASVLASSALVGGAAVALALFDPSTGKPRYVLVEDGE